MITFFYSLGILFLGWELLTVLYPVRNVALLSFIANYNKLKKQSLEGPEQETSLLLVNQLLYPAFRYMLFNVFYTMWTLVGLFSSNWPVFLVIILLGTLKQLLLKGSDSIYHLSVIRYDAVVTIVVLLYLIYNHFNLG